MKFHEDILNGFKVIERTRFCHRNCYLQSSKGQNSKSIYPRVMVLALFRWLIFVWSFMKISWMVFKLQSRHDFVTDRQTDGWTDGQMTRAKTVCLPTLKGRDMITWTKAFCHFSIKFLPAHAQWVYNICKLFLKEFNENTELITQSMHCYCGRRHYLSHLMRFWYL